MSEPIARLGIITPSSNTALEPLTVGILDGVDDVTAHFSRFRVTQISLSSNDLDQFDHRPILEAAELLIDARVDAIGWSGTSGGWLGFDQDYYLCESIFAATGIPTTSSVQSLNKILKSNNVKTFGLVSPYDDLVQQRIIANYRALGIECVAERHSGVHENFSFADIDAATLTRHVGEVAAASPQVIVLYCTNLFSAHLVAGWEASHGIPVIDSTATVVWQLLKTVGKDPARIEGWGRFFQGLK